MAEMEAITKKNLIKRLMMGEYSEVVEICRRREVRRMKITHSGGTALHMAVYEGQELTVEALLELMEEETDPIDDDFAADDDEGRRELALADDKGNTALHLAARMGNERMCVQIARKMPGLISFRNKDNETPLFLAALHGKTRAFMFLSIICCWHLEDGWDKIYQYGRRNSDGTTVLHCAIDGEFFELAYQIIVRFPHFLHFVDERGYSALHLLATKHSSFRSSSSLTWRQTLIYHCIPVEKPSVTEDSGDVVYDSPAPSALFDKHSKGTDVENPPLPKIRRRRGRICSPALVFIKCLYLKTGALLKHGLLRTKFLFPKQIVEMKEKHLWAMDVKDVLIRHAAYHDYLDNGSKPQPGYGSSYPHQIPEKSHLESNQTQKDAPESPFCSFTLSFSHTKQGIDVARLLNAVSNSLVSLETNQKNQTKKETPILIAAKNGITEIVEDILKEFPVAIHDVNSEGKNLMLMAVENRQPHVFQLLLKSKATKSVDDLFLCLDNEGNSALHLAALLKTYQPWLAPNAILQMQWEIKWYECIMDNMPKHLLTHQNNEGKTAQEVFMETHSELVQNDTEWLMKTSDSCTIVAALIATVAFATMASVPGGTDNNGEPVLKQDRMFKVFSTSSLGALCFSLTALVMFLAILTSRHKARDFCRDLPTKLLIGLAALFLSIASVLVSFCGGYFFVLKDVVRNAKTIEYVVAVIPVIAFVRAQFPLYFKLILATIKKVPERGFMVATGSSEQRGGLARAEASPNLRITTTVNIEDPKTIEVLAPPNEGNSLAHN